MAVKGATKKSARTKKVTLEASGLTVTIKKMTPLAFGKVYDGAEGMELTYRLVEACTVSPKLRALEIGDPGLGDDELSVDEVELHEFLELGNIITEFSGMKELGDQTEDFSERATTVL